MIRTNVKQLPNRRNRRLNVWWALVTSMFVSMTFVSGCESSVNSYCITRCDCQGCSQVERADCLDDVEDSERLAEHDGCATEFSDYLGCYANEGACMSGAWFASTCTVKGSALRDCSSRSAKFVKNACEEEVDKRASCGLSGGGTGPCGSVDECAALCALAAPCNELASPADTTYSNCVFECTSSSSSSGGSSGGP
jgi:hypothetical protein